MGLFRQVYTKFWTDERVLEEFTPEDKLFFLYLITNPSTTQVGIYKITKKEISFQLGYSIESVNAMMDRFINNHKLIRYNEKTRELAIKNWGRFNLNRGGKPVIDCIKKEIKEVKDKTLLEYISKEIIKEDIKQLFEYKGESSGGQFSSNDRESKYATTYKNEDEITYEKPSKEQLEYARGL